MNLKNLLAISLLSVLMLSSCKKDEKGDTVFFGNGSVSGTIKGTKLDNSVLDETFTFSKYLPILNEQYYQIDYDNNNQYDFNIEYSDENSNSFRLEFTLSSLTDNTPADIDFSFNYYKALANNKMLHFDMTENNNTAVISDFSFDANTGKLKCKLVVTGTTNSTEKNATVTANIDLTLKERVE